MALPYRRKFNAGRGSDQFLNEELHQVWTALENINYRKNENRGVEPSSNLDGALWLDKIEGGQLKYWDEPSKSWKMLFSKLFQITSQITNFTVPTNPVLGQLWIYNDALLYFDGLQWRPIKALIQDETQFTNAAFEDYIIVTPLNTATHNVKDTHLNTNFLSTATPEWTPDSKLGYEVEYPEPFPVAYDEEAVSQFVIPNINTDRIFLDNLNDTSYDEVTKVCIAYKEKAIHDKIVTAIHMNPGKLTKITKRLIKVDRLNPTLEMSAYNTEFYGFRADRTGGDFLIPGRGNTQDVGDYVAAGNHVILNYNATQNYDYILAITFDFTWIKSDGMMEKHSGKENTTSLYVTNLKTPIAVHSDGLMLEEAVYDVDAAQKVVTIKDDVTDVDVDMWSPAISKEYGYIREIDLEGNGIIRLHHKPKVPLVFVGGILMHPLYSGIDIDLEKGIITIPNESPQVENMKGQPWCVVDIYGMGDRYGRTDANDEVNGGKTVETEGVSVYLEEDIFDVESNDAYAKGYFEDTDDPNIRDFILAAGTFEISGFVDIYYDPNRIEETDGILLFVNGLLVCPDDIERYAKEGILHIEGMEAGAEYLLLKDPRGCVYSHADMMEAYNIGLLSDSLVYYKGKLLANENCVATTDTPEVVAVNGAVHNEIKLFIEDEFTQAHKWKIYDAYNYEWNELIDKEIIDVETVTGAYINLLTTVQINLDNYDKDELQILAFKFANSSSGLYKSGEVVWLEDDEHDGLPIFIINGDPYAHGMNNLNLYKNGLKLINGLDYKELDEDNKIKLLTSYEEGRDKLLYIVEPIENGEMVGYEQVILSQENAVQPNIYKLDVVKDEGISLYPGRLTVYVNGLRISNKDWTIIDNYRIMLNYQDYMAVSETAGNYPTETISKDDKELFKVEHKYPDYIVVEIRKDYDRKEVTVNYTAKDGHQLFVVEKEIPEEILDCKDDVIFYVNGQYTGMSRRSSRDYNFNKYKGCIEILDPDVLNMLNQDPMQKLFVNNAVYEAWKKQTGKDSYENDKINKITIVWR